MERKEAIEVVKKNYPHCAESGTQFETALRTLIPELVESEDEKIRKYLISFVELNSGVNLPPEDAEQILAWLEKQGEQKENATRDKIAKYLKDLILDQSQRCTPMLNYEGRIEEEVDFIINIAKNELKQCEQKPANKEYTFNAIPRLLELIQQPTDKAKSYCQKLIDSLEQEGYSTDAKIVRERLKIMEGETVAMATMDEQKPSWSDDDDIFFKAIIRDIENIPYISEDAKKDRINWLKSLCSQSKNEWSERDEEEFQIAIDTLVEAGQHDSAHWLESLKVRVVQPQNHWKPSDKQMADLWNMVCDCRPADQQLLHAIYCGLKELKEE